jgi:2-polyprenyl-3-methyl-5-hydroxy-6-metoxy-1,4-benzoquinol methylase
MIVPLQDRRVRQAAEAVALLYHAGAHRVWLFGSIARGEVKDRRSDLDLAVEGLRDEQVQRLRLHLRATLRCKVDVVGMERALPQLREGILKCRVPISRESCRTPESFARTLPSIDLPVTAPRSLQQSRLQAVADALRNENARSVLDLGCGPGLLLERLAADPHIRDILGVDFSPAALNAARQRLGSIASADHRVQLLHALATNPDPRFKGYDAVTAVELLEHFDAVRLAAFGRVIFSYLRPRIIVMTTPNVEYNVRWCAEPRLRRKDHRFEWTRLQFRQWISNADSLGAYSSSFQQIGTPWKSAGSPTQMVTLTRPREKQGL